ncbi:M20 family metallopeptidase [Infirmifilum lucidum]|uniref:M20 family metallopeptidase n=1 Tax=Infirmifilum lucidum TaxID=2776706 RepID=A0A7L9FHS0_9CREN|nr:M20 family metallopeptidase [Infirmifilum lucidum]QOJ78315.1 M20 family metallopeptidase [Infirmifilum lucidum]
MAEKFDMVKFLTDLVRIPSESGYQGNVITRKNYREVVELIQGASLDNGLSVQRVDLLGGEIPTLIISLPGAPKNKPSLAFVTHYDVVPAKGPWIVDGQQMDPYEPVVKDGKVYGRGAADDKSAIAAALAGLIALKGSEDRLRYNPMLVVTGDEEVGGTGVKALLEQGLRWDRVIIVDSGSEYVSVGASGVIHGWIKVKGKSGHAGYPHGARNAVEDLLKLLWELQEYKSIRSKKVSKLPSPPGSPVPCVWGRFTITVLKLPETEPEKHNRIPGEAWAGFDMRLIPEERVDEALGEFYAFFSSAVAKLGVNASVEVITGQPGWFAKNELFVREVVEAAKRAYRDVGFKGEPSVVAELGGNDGTHFDFYGMDVVAFGTIREGTNIHSEGEFVYVEDLEMFKRFMLNLLVT